MPKAQPAWAQALLPEEIESYRDHMWQREPEARVETATDAERLIDRVGFCAAMTDARRTGPSLYVAVCGRRDAFMPRNVQKDPESSLTWLIKDEVMRRGRVYYAKLAKGRALFIAPRLVPYFNALYGVPRRAEKTQLSSAAQTVLKVLRREWELATSDLRKAARIDERAQLTRALDELQRTMKVVPCDVLYEPWFTYIWMPAEARFAAELRVKVTRDEALREIARAYLLGAGQTARGELARVIGLSRPDAGRGNHALVAGGFALRLGVGIYRLTALDRRLGELVSDTI
jgi:hypothetical protein